MSRHLPEPEVEGGPRRLLVELAGPIPADLGERLQALAAADRLAGVVVDGDAEVVDVPCARLLAGAFEPEGGAHGVVVAVAPDADAEMEVTALRRAWGQDGIVVVAVGTSRHQAMEAGEFGADAVLFDGPLDDVVDCLAWWQALFVLPAAARATPATFETLVRAGADILVVDAAMATADAGERLAAAEAARTAAP